MAAERRSLKIALAGNPNSGKTSIFNGLTGAHQKVANFPGVTVEKRVGFKKYRNYNITFVDLPGTYSLTAYTIDEKVARNFIINEKPDVIINVIDSGSLGRSLYLTTQLIEMGVDLVIDLNMWDEIQHSGIEIDTDKLSKLLGAPVVKTVGSRGQGIDSLLETSIAVAEHGDKSHRHPPVSYGPQLDDVITNLTHEIGRCRHCHGCGNPRWLAVKMLEGDREIEKRYVPSRETAQSLSDALDSSLEHLKATNPDDPEIIITEGRYGYVAGIIKEVMTRPPVDRMKTSEMIDHILTHKFWGYPIFLLFMYIIFEATFSLGGYPMDWIDAGVGGLQKLATAIIPAGVIADMIIDGIIGGVGAVIIFLPNIIILFLGISLLEDSGYMARAAFLMDKLMHYLGLHGKSFIPMLIGFGCSVPAIMSTRTLESRKDRILTILLIPFMSCSARLPVYILFAGAFFGASAGRIIFLIYIIGVLAAIVAARILVKTVVRGESLPFVMELPPYRRPTGKSVAIHMWERTKVYLQKMGGVILIASIILWALGYFPKRVEYSQDYTAQIEQLQVSDEADSADRVDELEAQMAAEDLEYTFIGRMGDAVAPVVAPLGFNWRMGVALATGFVAKEVVVSSMGVLYQLGDGAESNSETLINKLRSPESGISRLAAFVFMVFVLLYTPCLPSVIAVMREIGWRWMLFSIFFQTTVAWISSFIIYQAGRFIGL